MNNIENFLIKLNINKFQHAAILCGFFTLFFYMIYFIVTAISTMIPYRLVLYSDNINNIPFLDYFAIIYLTIGLYLFMGVFILDTKEKINWYVYTLVIETLIAAVFFILMPLQSGFIPINPSQDIFGKFYWLARIICIGHNYFPSLHIAFTTTAMLVFIRTSMPILGKLLLVLWWILIILSTLFIHVHYPIDIAGGIILAIICSKLIFFKRTAELNYSANATIKLLN